MTTLGNVALTVSVVTAFLLFLGSWLLGPSLALLGPIHYMTLVPAIAGFVLMAEEWRTRGAHRYLGAGLALCAATLVLGFVVSATGLRMLFNLLATDAIASDAVRFRQMMAIGISEATGFFYRYAATAVLQLLLWAMLASRLTASKAVLGAGNG